MHQIRLQRRYNGDTRQSPGVRYGTGDDDDDDDEQMNFNVA